ncbi:hypothetical protein [Nocardia farcinica]|uniref:hypothetical protein n=1 Tax=Nocardia farcinica TaxID=37329 RepID=UPI00379D4ECC
MAQVTIEVDEAALAMVGALLGTAGRTEETVNAALHEVLAQRKRMAVLERMMVRAGERVVPADPWRKTPAWP